MISSNMTKGQFEIKGNKTYEMPLLKLNTFRVRMRCLKRLLNIKWRSKVINNEVLKEVNLAREPAQQVDISFFTP